MFLKEPLKTKSKRFEIRNIYLNTNFAKKCNIKYIHSIKKKLFLKYKKRSKAYFKVFKRTNYKNLIKLPLEKIPTNSTYSVIYSKKEFSSRKVVGLVQLIVPFRKKWFYHHKKKPMTIGFYRARYEKFLISGSLFFLPMFWGFDIRRRYNVNPFMVYNSLKDLIGFISILANIFVGSSVFNVYDFESGRTFGVSPGSYCVFNDYYRDYNITSIVLPSKYEIKLNSLCSVIYGRPANIFSKFVKIGKAANRFYLKKKKVNVRGVAMNPVDHPNGGRSKVKKPFLTPWGKIAKKGK